MSSREEIFFSIITPVKNGCKYLKRYLASLKNQEFKNWEAIIIVDDGSSDDSYRVLKNLTKSDNRFKVLKNYHINFLNSPYESRNIGLDNAIGKYICFLDIDDIWLPKNLLRHYQIINNYKNINLIYSEYYRYQEEKNIFSIRKPIKILNIDYLLNFINPIPMLSTCVKKDIVNNIRFKALHHEDYLFWKELIKKILNKNIFLDKSPTTIYLISKGSISSNKFKAILWIYKIYLLDSKNYIVLFFKLIIRGFLQVYIYLLDQKVNKQELKDYLYLLEPKSK